MHRPELEKSLAAAKVALGERPRLERERHELSRLLDDDREARAVELGTHAPDYLVDRLGSRPPRGPAAELWDEAASRIDQHRAAFDLTELDDLIDVVPWDDSAFAVRHREAEAARERLDRLLGREPEIEPPGLELDIGW